MGAFTSCVWGTSTSSKFQRKALPVLKRLEALQLKYQQEADNYDKCARAQEKLARAALDRGDTVPARSAAAAYRRHIALRDRWMAFAGRIGSSISQIDNLYSSHLLIENTEEIGEELRQLAGVVPGVADLEKIDERIDVTKDLHSKFADIVKAMEQEVSRIPQNDVTETDYNAVDDLLSIWKTGAKTADDIYVSQQIPVRHMSSSSSADRPAHTYVEASD